MTGAIAYVLKNTSHRLSLWYIYVNTIKHLAHAIHNHLSIFKRCVYKYRSKALFIYKWHKLLSKYNLEDNQWVKNLHDLRKKWIVV